MNKREADLLLWPDLEELIKSDEHIIGLMVFAMGEGRTIMIMIILIVILAIIILIIIITMKNQNPNIRCQANARAQRDHDLQQDPASDIVGVWGFGGNSCRACSSQFSYLMV